MDYTQLSQIPTILDELRTTFRSGITKPLAWRRHQLLQLARFAQENADDLAECLRLDLGRPKQEAFMTEIGPIIERCLICVEKLEEWAKPEKLVVTDWQAAWKPRVEKHPKGVVLIIAPWNYPIILSLQPLYGAISAGCCAVLKPSEISANVSSFLARTLPKYLDQSAYRVILGGVPEATKILELKWDHIFYTGNGRVARIVSTAAAKHLTPLTLELGGKSPVIVDSTADIFLTAKRILWGKINNAGQICVAPDYILAQSSIVPSLIIAFKEHYDAFFPEGALASASYSRIISETHFARLKDILGRTNGKIVTGGNWENEGGKLVFEPTVVTGVTVGDSLLDEEIFGPVLPIISVETLDDALEHINQRDHPLVLYAFTTSEENKRKIVANTTSGGVLFNDTFQQLSVGELPFGGVGESGYGRQVLKYSFDNFVYERGILDIPYQAEPSLAIRYPPYTAQSLMEFMCAVVKQAIPDDDKESLS
ncbi:NADP-aldehyde dehydrogenase [Phlegmacium glaucopus]|nr:NADP-aldehyde dehydrogenase [Phlegmacium glaucopus]